MAKAMARLESFIERRDDLRLAFDRTWSRAELEALAEKESYGVALPPSYCHFIHTYGPMKLDRGGGMEAYPMVQPDMMFGVSPDADDACGAGDEELEEQIDVSLGNALFFQYQSTEWVQDFFCFAKDSARDDGELTVIRYWHDEVFENCPEPASASKHSYTFEDHFCELVDEIISEYSR